MPADAQLRGLVKKAKKAVGIENSDDSQSSQSSQSSSSLFNSDSSKPKALKDLDTSLFIYPATDPANAVFYDVNSPEVQEAYAKYLETMSPGCPRQDPYGRHWLTEFATWQAADGPRQIHVSEYPFTAYYSYFMLNPDTPEGYTCYKRVRPMEDDLLGDLFRTFPRIVNERGWTDKYPNAEQTRKLNIEEYDGQLYLLETEENRSKRWHEVEDEAYEIMRQNTSYKTVKDAMRKVLDEWQELDRQGQYYDCYNLDRLAVRMKSDVESLSSNYGKFCDDFKADKDNGWQDILDDFTPLHNKSTEYYKAAQTHSSSVASMPKAANVSADIKNQATAQAKAKFGSSFVEAIVIEPDWHVYTDPNNFNRTSHRSIAVDVITKEGNDYIVNHQDLRQSYNAGDWGGYDMRNVSNGPTRSKVNYK